MSKIILITGTSTGVGLQTAVLLAGQGHTVYATMRNPEKKTALEKEAQKSKVSLRIMRLDVQDEASITVCVERILTEEKKSMYWSTMRAPVSSAPLNRHLWKKYTR